MKRYMLVAIALQGCVWALGPRSAGEQAHALLDHEDNLGHIDGKLQPVSDHEVATSVTGDALELSGIADGKACVIDNDSGQWFEYHETTDALASRRLAHAKRLIMHFGAVAELDQSGKATFPPAGASQTEARLLSQRVRENKDKDAPWDKTRSTYSLITKIEICAPAPAISPSSRFFTVVEYDGDERPHLFVWKFDAAPDASAIAGAAGNTGNTAPDGTADTGTADTGTAAPSKPTSSPVATPASSADLMTVIANDGRFTIFLKLLAGSDYADKLATGHYTLFLPTDDALAKVDTKRWTKDAKTLSRAVDSHIVGGVQPRAQLVEDTSGNSGFVKLQNEVGDRLKVTIESDTIHVSNHTTDKHATVVGPELSASNGVLYVIDAALY